MFKIRERSADGCYTPPPPGTTKPLGYLGVLTRKVDSVMTFNEEAEQIDRATTEVLDIIERLVVGVTSPRRARYWFFAGSIASKKLADNGRSLEYFSRATASDQRWVLPLASRAEILVLRQQWDEAEREFRAALQRALTIGAPVRTTNLLWRGLGSLLRDHLGDPAGASLCFERADLQRSWK